MILFSEWLFHDLRTAAPGHVDESRSFGIPDEPDLSELERHRAQAMTYSLIRLLMHPPQEHEQKFTVNGEDVHGVIGNGAANGNIGITSQSKNDGPREGAYRERRFLEALQQNGKRLRHWPAHIFLRFGT